MNRKERRIEKSQQKRLMRQLQPAIDLNNAEKAKFEELEHKVVLDLTKNSPAEIQEFLDNASGKVMVGLEMNKAHLAFSEHADAVKCEQLFS